MGKREDFISSLDRYELAFLCKYKLDTYMRDTREYIQKVCADQGIFEADIEALIEERNAQAKEMDLGGCPRCHSDKSFFYETVYDPKNHSCRLDGSNYDDSSDGMTYETNQECAVCGYSENLGVTGNKKMNQSLKNLIIFLAILLFIAKLIDWIFGFNIF